MPYKRNVHGRLNIFIYFSGYGRVLSLSYMSGPTSGFNVYKWSSEILRSCDIAATVGLGVGDMNGSGRSV